MPQNAERIAPEAAPPIDPRALQVLWDEAHAQAAEAVAVAARLREVGDNVTQLRDALAREKAEEERLRNRHNELRARSETGRVLIAGHCRTHGLPLPQDPESAPPARADAVPACPHCSQAIAPNGEGWVHTMTGYPECNPGDPQSKVAASPDVRVAGPRDAAQGGNGVAS